ALCAGAAFLVGIALVLSGAPFLPEQLKVAISRIHQTAAANTAAVFNYQSGVQTYTVPDGISYVYLFAWGGGGQEYNGSTQGTCSNYTVYTKKRGSAGGGGYTSGKIAVTPGEKLYVVVGAVDGGGSGAHGDSGGGYSGVFTGPTPSQANALVVAGGGGGSGGYLCIDAGSPACGYNYACGTVGANSGVGGGTSGGDSGGATGGTQTGGGSGNSPGSALAGGAGGGDYGGGGGAGWYGGGGGSSGGSGAGQGGAGGSGYCAPSVVDCTTVASSNRGTAAMSDFAPSGAGNSENAGAVVISAASLSLTACDTGGGNCATTKTVGAGGSATLHYTVSGASQCLITSPNGLVGAQGLGTDASGNGNLWVPH